MNDPKFIPDRLTPVSVEQLIDALRAGYVLTMGSEPAPSCLACLGAQLCLESGNGQKAHCFNWGNKKLPAEWDGFWTTFWCDEIFDLATAKRAIQLGPATMQRWKPDDPGPERYRVVLQAGHPWARFKAYETAEDGAADYVAFLCQKELVWTAAYVGDASRFSHELRRAKYYTADEKTYTAGLVSIAKRIRPACDQVLLSLGHGLTDEDRAEIEGLVALTLADSLGWVRAVEPEALT